MILDISKGDRILFCGSSISVPAVHTVVSETGTDPVVKRGYRSRLAIPRLELATLLENGAAARVPGGIRLAEVFADWKRKNFWWRRDRMERAAALWRYVQKHDSDDGGRP